MLTIVGYSINATIVIFDRIRENLKLKDGMAVSDIAVSYTHLDVYKRQAFTDSQSWMVKML